MFNFFKNLTGNQTIDFAELIQNGALILDVRTRAEYQGGHVAGSKNIPLNELGSHVAKLQKSGKPVITCCASGMRSGSAANILKRSGVDAYNGGPWTRVNAIV